MADTHARVDSTLHEKMKNIAKLNNRTVYEEYELALKAHIKEEAQKLITFDSELELFINDRFNKLDNHLASMLARTGMDTSMVLMGLLLFLEKFFNGKYTREEIQDMLRRDGARYFSTAIKKDKEKKQSNNQVLDSST